MFKVGDKIGAVIKLDDSNIPIEFIDISECTNTLEEVSFDSMTIQNILIIGKVTDIIGNEYKISHIKSANSKTRPLAILKKNIYNSDFYAEFSKNGNFALKVPVNKAYSVKEILNKDKEIALNNKRICDVADIKMQEAIKIIEDVSELLKINNISTPLATYLEHSDFVFKCFYIVNTLGWNSALDWNKINKFK